jgi:cupin 2 domain-containing protein
MMTSNIYSCLPPDLRDEIFETLAESDAVRIERIISNGQSTAEGEWYDQDWDEWVLLLTGSAGLLFEGEESPRKLAAGDYVLIPAHCRHRVAWTDQQRQTLWLAVHIRGSFENNG